MTREKARKIAEMIRLIAETVAATRISRFAENAENAAINERITGERMRELEDLLIDL